MPRHPRQEPDLSAFEPIISEAVRAFGTDLSYATAMAAKAHVIMMKRLTWLARSQVREAEAVAREQCEAGPAFVCPATAAPCGTTDQCRYSTGTLRELVVTPAPLGPMRGGKLVTRPQVGAGGVPSTYNSEAAVMPLREQLEVLPRLA